ncbi:HDOD domain-containing protein [Ectothiorhodospiraceae bacterium BW-2]|nr:HDOD domain-containing protein [Ectothiorhodospiraceae bacterium BW-2]
MLSRELIHYHTARLQEELCQGRIELPSMPDVLFHIRQALYDEGKTIEELGRTVQLDGSVASQLIKLANSASFMGTAKVADCKGALTLLGLEATRNIVTALMMQKAYQSVRDPRLTQMVAQSWQRSCHIGALCQIIGSFTPGMRADRAMLGGIIHNIGMLPLLGYFEHHADELLEHTLAMNQLIRQFQGRLGQKMLAHWQFDTDLTSVPELSRNPYYDSGSSRISVVDIVVVARVHLRIKQPQEREASIEKLQRMPAYHKLSISKLGADATIQLLEEADDEIRSLMQILNHDIAT